MSVIICVIKHVALSVIMHAIMHIIVREFTKKLQGGDYTLVMNWVYKLKLDEPVLEISSEIVSFTYLRSGIDMHIGI